MIKNYTDIAFTPSVKEIQSQMGSRKSYERMEAIENNTLSAREQHFIENREMFYMSTVGENGWPYVQHRGGPKGFLKVLSPTQIGFADFRGNMQYISTGNLRKTNKVALILMDYPRRTRLKIWAETEVVKADDEKLAEELQIEDYSAQVENFVLMNVKAFDWNCPQHITPRFTLEEYRHLLESGELTLDEQFLNKLRDKQE